MSISQKSLTPDLQLIVIGGRLDQTQIDELESILSKSLEAGHINLLIDLSAVSYVNSSGLRCLVTSWRQARGRGGNVSLCGLNPRISEVFNVVGFSKVFDIYPDCEAAKKALGKLDS